MELLRTMWTMWRRFGRWMGDQVARVFLVAFYFTIALPFGLVVRFTQDPLDMRAKSDAGWVTRSANPQTLAEGERLY